MECLHNRMTRYGIVRPQICNAIPCDFFDSQTHLPWPRKFLDKCNFLGGGWSKVATEAHGDMPRRACVGRFCCKERLPRFDFKS